MSKDIFNDHAASVYLEIIRKIALHPPSEDTMDKRIPEEIDKFIAITNRSPKQVWNFYKFLLDITVHGALGSSFVLSILDIEPYWEAPEGGLNQADKSIEHAPWRTGELEFQP